MPQSKQPETKIQNGRMLEAIAGSSAFFDLSPNEQARIAQVSRSTWYRRLSNPGQITLDEFRRMIQRYGWDDAVILQIVR